MKRIISISIFYFVVLTVNSQKSKQHYPTPEFNNEIYFFIKDSAEVSRLEKGSAKMDTKMKMAGFGGSESGYVLEGSRSPVRLQASPNLSFLFFMSESSKQQSSETDSLMKANGMEQPVMDYDPMAMMTDPSRTTSLYKMSPEKGVRKITIMASSGMRLIGSAKKESVKYSLSIKKVRQGYYELVVDKPLLRGEYAFMITDMSSMTGEYKFFAFGID